MGKPMVTMAGPGADLRDLLMQELNIPPTAKWFEVRFGLGEPVTVRCEFLAEEQPEEPDEVDPPAQQSHRGLDG
jgi:hypothetical protein